VVELKIMSLEEEKSSSVFYFSSIHQKIERMGQFFFVSLKRMIKLCQFGFFMVRKFCLWLI